MNYNTGQTFFSLGERQVIPSIATDPYAPGGTASWFQLVSAQIRNNSLNNARATIGVGVSEKELNDEGYTVDAEDGSSYSAHRYVQNGSDIEREDIIIAKEFTGIDGTKLADPVTSWLVTDIMGTVSNGTMVIDGAFKFVENSKTGRFLANGYQHVSKAEMAKTLKLAKPLTRGIAVVNVISTATAATDDFVHGRYKSGSARVAIWGIAAGTAFIPGVGWGISLGIGIADAIWGDDFYEYVEKNW